ncbi:uncharacterized protein UTRI_03299_B [Ustilago trichophora]|uniref:Uncharacterized protein n=1 Tax=Ustilago trichophora TaxID=86804 RepID=A0A5C3E671_9BASI|nr:uncharacterized protein UTRI_03299_B [Ustilago trichophora]
MVKSNTSSWQQLYRALLRSSSAAVRFSRPAARNTRRYLRDEFAGAIVANNQLQVEAVKPPRGRGRPRLDRPVSSHEDVSGGGDESMTARQANTPIWPPRPTPSRDGSVRQLLGQQTHHTLAFHLSASLLPGSNSSNRIVLSAQEFPTNTKTITDVAQQYSPPVGVVDDPPSPLCRNTSSQLRDDANRQRGIDVGSATNDLVGLSTRKKPARLAHRVIANLSSLTYHHLSPYTQMQSRAHLKDNRALRKPKKLSSLARVLGKLDGGGLAVSPDAHQAESGLEDALLDGREDDTLVNEAHMKLGFLLPTVKPKRGPVSARLKEWDGQDADKVGSEGGLRQMEADLVTIERLLEDYDAEAKGDRSKRKQLSKQIQQLKAEAEQLRKTIKSATKALAQAESQRQMENIPIEHLADLVVGAQEAEGILLGKNRWTRCKNGDFLPP